MGKTNRQFIFEEMGVGEMEARQLTGKAGSRRLKPPRQPVLQAEIAAIDRQLAENQSPQAIQDLREQKLELEKKLRKLQFAAVRQKRHRERKQLPRESEVGSVPAATVMLAHKQEALRAQIVTIDMQLAVSQSPQAIGDLRAQKRELEVKLHKLQLETATQKRYRARKKLRKESASSDAPAVAVAPELMSDPGRPVALIASRSCGSFTPASALLPLAPAFLAISPVMPFSPDSDNPVSSSSPAANEFMEVTQTTPAGVASGVSEEERKKLQGILLAKIKMVCSFEKAVADLEKQNAALRSEAEKIQSQTQLLAMLASGQVAPLIRAVTPGTQDGGQLEESTDRHLFATGGATDVLDQLIAGHEEEIVTLAARQKSLEEDQLQLRKQNQALTLRFDEYLRIFSEQRKAKMQAGGHSASVPAAVGVSASSSGFFASGAAGLAVVTPNDPALSDSLSGSDFAVASLRSSRSS